MIDTSTLDPDDAAARIAETLALSCSPLPPPNSISVPRLSSGIVPPLPQLGCKGEGVADWDGLDVTTSHLAVEQRLDKRGWTRCGAGDWAIALCSPDGEFAARISPFDPTGPLTADLYRRAAFTGRVPRVAHHSRLEGGGDLLVMERLEPAQRQEAVAFLADIATDAPSVRELAVILRQVHAEGVQRLPWCGPLDMNPANVMRRLDGTLVLTDPFYADGPNLYSAALHDPERVARLIPAAERRYLTEIPLAASGPWSDGEQDRIRAALLAADASQIRLMSRRLGFDAEVPMNDTALRASEAARRLGISTKQLLALIHAREIDYVMRDGIAHVPESAIEKYRASAS